MTSLKNTFAAAALVAAPLAFAGHVAEAATVTGDLTLSANAVVSGSVTGHGGWELVLAGNFGVTGDLSSDTEPADDWSLSGSIGVPGLGALTQTTTWGGGPISAMDLVIANLPYSSDILFTVFANSMLLLNGAVLGGGSAGEYTILGGWGLLPAGDKITWSILPSTVSVAPGAVDITGNFVFTLSGSNILLSALTLAEFLDIDIDSIPDDIAGAILGGIAGIGLPLELSMTLTPLNDTPHPPAVIPLPAAMPLLAGGLGLLGVMGWRRRRA